MRPFRRCNQCRTDAGAEKLEGDFLTVAEFDSIAIGAVFEPREDDLFLVLDAEARLEIARYPFELEIRIVLNADCRRAIARRGEANASRRKPSGDIFLKLACRP